MSRKLEIQLEKSIVETAIEGLFRAGFWVGVDDGEETHGPYTSVGVALSSVIKEVMEHVCKCDEEDLIAFDAQGNRVGWVFLVWGNVEEIISDYSTNLETALTEAHKLADFGRLYRCDHCRGRLADGASED